MTLKPVVIDLYSGDQVEDWNAVRNAGIQGVILKSSEGISYHDSAYARRRKAAAAAGLLCGSYHFQHSGNVAEQVDSFLRAAGDLDGLLLALDWETPPHGTAMSAAEARQFLTLLMAKTGRTPDQIYIYGGNVLKEKITSAEDVAFFGQFRLWLCQYAKSYTLPKAWKKYDLWQCSADGYAGPLDHEVAKGVPGISTPNIDMNLYGGTDLVSDWAPGAAAVGAIAGSEAGLMAPASTVSTLAAVAKTAKTVQASHSLWAIINGWIVGILAMFTDWIQHAFTWVVSLVTDITQGVDDTGALDSASKLQDWLQLDQATILKFTLAVVATVSIIVFVRHLRDKQNSS